MIEVGREGRRPLLGRVGIVAIVGAQATLFILLTPDAWFFSDDFLFLAQGREASLSWEFLTLGLFEHFSPVHRLGDYVFAHVFGLNWRAAQAVLVLLMATNIICFWLLVRCLARPGLAASLTALYGTSLFFIRNATWWTGGTHLLALTLFQLLTLFGFVRWYQERRSQWLGLSLGAHVLALLTHEQALLTPGFLVLLYAFVLEPATPSLRLLLRRWKLWALFAVPTAAALANFWLNYRQETETAPAGDMVRYFWLSLFEGFLPTLLGLKYPEAKLASTALTVTLAAAAAAAVVLVSLRRNLRAWRAWAFFGLCFLLATLPLGLGRVAMFGAEVGREPRYQMAPAYLVLLAAGAAFVLPERRRIRMRGQQALALGFAAVYLFLHIRGAGRIEDSSGEWVAPRQFFERFRVAVVRESAKGPVSLFPGTVPDPVVPAWLFPYNRYEHALLLARPGLEIGTSRQGFVVTTEGELRPAHFESVLEVDLGEVRTHLAGTERIVDPAALCVRSEIGGSLGVQFPLTGVDGPLIGLVLRVQGTAVEVLSGAPGGPSALYPPMTFHDGRHEAYLRANQTAIDAVGFSLAGPGSMCLERLEIGRVR